MRSETKVALAAVVCGAAGAAAMGGFGTDRASAGRDDITVTLPVTTATIPVPTLPVSTTVPTTSIPELPTTSVPTLPVTTTVPSLPVTTTVPTITLPTTTTSPPTTRSGGGGTTTASPATTESVNGKNSRTGTGPTAPSAGGSLGPRCRSRRGLPDRRCTPGARAHAFRLPKACGARRSRVAAPSAHVVNAVLGAYGIPKGSRGRYRIDRLISVALGGSNAKANVWPQPASGRLNAGAKDRVEAYLLRLVCQRKLSLRRAQVKLATNWVAVYRSLPRGAR